MPDLLKRYWDKRDFSLTPEPKDAPDAKAGPDTKRKAGALSFVIQKHAASRLHYDFRLELDGTLKSWAVPKGPSLDPKDKRMGVHVEDHPLSYAAFEGTIPPKQYGAGTVIVWDRGEWVPSGDPHEGYAAGKLKFELRGEKLHGNWTLVRMRGHGEEQEPWLLIKERDEAARPASEYSVVDELPNSVLNPGIGVDLKPAGARPPAEPRAAEPAERSAARPVDKPAAKTKASKATAAAKKSASAGEAKVAGLRITHPERVIDASSGVTKLELAQFYELVSASMLPHLKARPVSLVRGPEGVGGQLFFQKHADPRTMPTVKQLDPSFDPEHGPLLEIDSIAGLLGAVQMNVIEFHTWNSTTRNIEKPDRMTFDLDPGEGAAWKLVQEGAQLTRALLEELGLKSFLKTSGGKGLHVVVPLAPKHGWDAVKDLSELVVERLAETLPDRFVAKSGAKNRVGKIFVDYLRNGRGATTAAAFSARARPGMGVSVPVAWEELDSLASGSHWTVRTAAERIEMKDDPWAGYKASRQTLAKAMKMLGFKA